MPALSAIRLPVVLPAVVAALVCGWVVSAIAGTLPGLAAALVVVPVTIRTLGRLEPRSAVRARGALDAQLPIAVDLLGGCLDAGLSLSEAVRRVAVAVPDPIGSVLGSLARAESIGVDPADAWRDLDDTEALAGVGLTVSRAVTSGAALRASLSVLADDLRSRQRWATQARIARLESLAVLPLTFCFLPAFVALGIVPQLVVTVADMVGQFG